MRRRPATDFEAFCDRPEPAVLTVGEVTRSIRELLERSFSSLQVRGEVSNLSRPQSGHVYFSLVDGAGASRGGSRLSSSQLPCVLWRSAASRLRFRLENGQKVVVSGRLGVYEPRGTYQLVGERVEVAGVGELQLRFEQLKERLKSEGLFDEDRKRPLPYLPECVGLVTSPTGAAVQDVLRALLRRFPRAWIRLVPVKVQGEDAAAQIAQAVDFLNASGDADVIIVTRGGGSLEDLWAFNEEEVARALFRSAAPTVSAVGHEVDFTIADFVADARAQTPTQAGEMVVPRESALRESLEVIGTRARLAVERRLERCGHTLERLLKSRPLERPETLVAELFERCDDVAEGLKFHLYNRCRGWDDSLAALSGRLEALSPLKVLARGYSVTRDSYGHVVQDAALVKEGQELDILLARGDVGVRVLRTGASGENSRSPGKEAPASASRSSDEVSGGVFGEGAADSTGKES